MICWICQGCGIQPENTTSKPDVGQTGQVGLGRAAKISPRSLRGWGAKFARWLIG